ncbi:MAG: transcription elongation factor GreA [Clostridia bacterium]|jgi:transcription elongation factor GreA
MANKEVVLTYEGLKKLEGELELLKSAKRREIAERIKQALSFGDISENSEYDDAKNEQAQVEGRIVTIENMLKNAKLIDEDDVSTDLVSIGSKVKLFDVKYNEEVEYHIVGSTETDPVRSKISNESPVGAALIGKKKGNTVEVIIPDGRAKYKILEIRK